MVNRKHISGLHTPPSKACLMSHQTDAAYKPKPIRTKNIGDASVQQCCAQARMVALKTCRHSDLVSAIPASSVLQ